MRTLDAEPIAKALEALAIEGTIASEAFQLAERWRTRLLDGGDDEIDAICAERPALDRTELRQTVRAAQKERKERELNRDKPTTNQKKVFRLLREVFVPRFDSLVAGDPDRDADLDDPDLDDEADVDTDADAALEDGSDSTEE